MSGISDAAAITWAVKSNMDSSACMNNQMKMYRKGVLDGKDGDTSVDEDWTSNSKKISFEIDDFNNKDDLPGNAVAPAAVDLKKGLTWKFLANGSDPNDPTNYMYARVWINDDVSYDDDWYHGIEYGMVFGNTYNAYGEPQQYTSGNDWGIKAGNFAYRRSYSAIPKGIYGREGNGSINSDFPNKLIRLNSTTWYNGSTTDALFVWGTYQMGNGSVKEANNYYSYPGTGLTLYVPNSSTHTFMGCSSIPPVWLTKE